MKISAAPFSFTETSANAGPAKGTTGYGDVFESAIRTAEKGTSSKSASREGADAAPAADGSDDEAISAAEQEENREAVTDSKLEPLDEGTPSPAFSLLGKLFGGYDTADARTSAQQSSEERQEPAGEIVLEERVVVVSLQPGATADDVDAPRKVTLEVLGMETHFEPRSEAVVLVDGDTSLPSKSLLSGAVADERTVRPSMATDPARSATGSSAALATGMEPPIRLRFDEALARLGASPTLFDPADKSSVGRVAEETTAVASDKEVSARRAASLKGLQNDSVNDNATPGTDAAGKTGAIGRTESARRADSIERTERAEGSDGLELSVEKGVALTGEAAGNGRGASEDRPAPRSSATRRVDGAFARSSDDKAETRFASAALTARIDEGAKDGASPLASMTGQVAGQIIDTLGAVSTSPRSSDKTSGDSYLRFTAGGAALKTLTIQLQPENLGVLDVSMRLIDGQLTLELAASEANTAKLLAEDQEGLRKLLQHAGFSMDEASITIVTRDPSADSRIEVASASASARQDGNGGSGANGGNGSHPGTGDRDARQSEGGRRQNGEGGQGAEARGNESQASRQRNGAASTYI